MFKCKTFYALRQEFLWLADTSARWIVVVVCAMLTMASTSHKVCVFKPKESILQFPFLRQIFIGVHFVLFRFRFVTNLTSPPTRQSHFAILHLSVRAAMQEKNHCHASLLQLINKVLLSWNIYSF